MWYFCGFLGVLEGIVIMLVEDDGGPLRFDENPRFCVAKLNIGQQFHWFDGVLPHDEMSLAKSTSPHNNDCTTAGCD